jgi:cation:H+ antiporter
MMTVLGLALGAVLTSDGFLSRADGFLLVAAWAGAVVWSWRFVGPQSEPDLVVPDRSRMVHLLLLLGSIALVLVGAGAAVQGLIGISRMFGVPEYILSFFGASFGTSLPEIVVSITALRLGQKDLAMGDILGACLMDATLSMGIGPALAPTPVTAELAARGGLTAVAAVTVVSLLLWSRGVHDRWSAAVLLVFYVAGYFILFAG